MQKTYSTFTDFWPFYLREHSKPLTRGLHYLGTSTAVAIFGYAFMIGSWGWLVLLPIAGYGLAWVAHFFVEKNKPATFIYPAWSLIADFKMWWLWLTGDLKIELEKAGVPVS